jgi:hypothetical protein
MTVVDRESKVEPKTTALTRVAIAMSSIALVASSIALVAVLQSGQAERDDIEMRLQCLELPGPNDCGVDGE